MADEPVRRRRNRQEQEWIRRSREQFGDVEAAAELTPADNEGNSSERIRQLRSTVASAGRSLGWTAFIFGVLSWFIWPAFMGITAAVMGYFAFYQGSRTLGGIAVAMGGVAAAVYLILLPLYVWIS